MLFGKVFRLVSNKILLVKLNLYGIQGTSAYWFRSCLTDRRQEIELKSCNETQNFFLMLDTKGLCCLSIYTVFIIMISFSELYDSILSSYCVCVCVCVCVYVHNCCFFI